MDRIPALRCAGDRTFLRRSVPPYANGNPLRFQDGYIQAEDSLTVLVVSSFRIVSVSVMIERNTDCIGAKNAVADLISARMRREATLAMPAGIERAVDTQLNVFVYR